MTAHMGPRAPIPFARGRGPRPWALGPGLAITTRRVGQTRAGGGRGTFDGYDDVRNSATEFQLVSDTIHALSIRSPNGTQRRYSEVVHTHPLKVDHHQPLKIDHMINGFGLVFEDN